MTEKSGPKEKQDSWVKKFFLHGRLVGEGEPENEKIEESGPEGDCKAGSQSGLVGPTMSFGGGVRCPAGS